MMKRHILSVLSCIAFIGLLVLAEPTLAAGFEVWAVDQSDAATGGAKLYIWQGASLNGKNPNAVPEIIDLKAMGEDAGVGGGVRPHFLLFNTESTHGWLSHTKSEHLYVIDAETRTLAGFLPLEGHVAAPSPDSTLTLVLDAGGKTVTRVATDYANNIYEVNGVFSTVDLEPLTNGAAKPICTGFTLDSRYAYVTFSGGGLLVLDVKSTPMVVMDVYNSSEIVPKGCMPLPSPDGSTMYITSGNPDPADPDFVYAFDTSLIGTHPTPVSILAPGNDAHGGFFTRHGRFLWVSMRDSNEFHVIDTTTNKIVNTVPAMLVDMPDLDAAPDLMAVSPNGNRAYATLRGPNPHSANDPNFNNAVGNAPGVGVIKITAGGWNGEIISIAPIHSSLVDGVEQSDPHGLFVRLK